MRLFLILVLLTFSLSCETQVSKYEIAIAKQELKSHLTLYVSNKSFDIDPVDIKVLIDGQTFVDQYFNVENQHSNLKIEIPLYKGKHALQAISIDGDAVLDMEFELTEDRHWAVVFYLYDADNEKRLHKTKKGFIFQIRNSQMYFI